MKTSGWYKFLIYNRQNYDTEIAGELILHMSVCIEHRMQFAPVSSLSNEKTLLGTTVAGFHIYTTYVNMFEVFRLICIFLHIRAGTSALRQLYNTANNYNKTDKIKNKSVPKFCHFNYRRPLLQLKKYLLIFQNISVTGLKLLVKLWTKITDRRDLNTTVWYYNSDVIKYLTVN
jgi:hypothetical protein